MYKEIGSKVQDLNILEIAVNQLGNIFGYKAANFKLFTQGLQ